MGWTGYEIDIPLDIFFKKMYCHKCGAKMKKSKSSITTRRGEFGFSNRLAGKPTIGMSQRNDLFIIFICPLCGNTQTDENQKRISKLQKNLKKNILTDDEIKST